MTLSVGFTEINWLSVIVVTLLSFPLGSVWHSKLFGKAWKEDARPVFDGSKKINFIKLFGFSAVMHFIAIAGLEISRTLRMARMDVHPHHVPHRI